MSEDRNTYADVWDQLDPKWAERVRVTDAAALGDEEIVRRWPQIGEGYLSKCMKALSLFTDSSNSKPQLWVNNPVVGREVFPGVYRLVTVDVDVMKSGLKGIIQTLRKGFNEVANWSEARLAEYEVGPANNVAVTNVSPASDNPTRLLKVEFPNCSPDKAEAIARGLAAATHSNVVVRGETYSGAWNAVWAAAKIEDDGSATVTLFLALAQYNLVSYADFATERQQVVVYLYDVPKSEAQGIIDAWKTVHAIGSSATANYSRSNGLVDLVLRAKTGDAIEVDFGNVGVDCRYTESQVAIFGTDDEGAYPIPAVVAGAGVSYKRDVRSNGDGTFDVFLTKKEVKYRDVTGLVVEQSGAETTTQQQQLGVTIEPLASMEEETGKIKTQRVEINDDCSKDATTNVSVGKEMETETKVASAGAVETTVEKTYQAEPLGAPGTVKGHVKTVRNADSKYPGKYDTTQSDKQFLPLNAVAKGGSPLFDEEVTVNQNADTDQSGEAVGGEGVSIDRSSRKNDAGLFDNTTKKRTAKAFGPKTDIHGTPLVEETTHLFENTPLPSPGIPADGRTDDVSGRINADGKTSFIRTIRRAIARVFGPFRTEQDAFSQTDTTVKIHQDSIAEMAGPNEILRVAVDVDEFGKLGAKVSKETPLASVKGPFTEHDDGYKITTKTVHRNVDSAPVVSFDDNGHDVSVTPNSYGKLDVVETKTTARPFYVDVQEPATSGKHPGFQRTHYGIGKAADIQFAVDKFVAKAAGIVDEQFNITVGVARDADGFYVVNMTASPKQSGGSVVEWESGFKIEGPKTKPRSTWVFAKTDVLLTTSRNAAETFINAGSNHIDGTSVQYIGRGRFKCNRITGSNT